MFAIGVLMLYPVGSVVAEPSTLTLACSGTTVAGYEKPEPGSMSLIIDFSAGTVQGFCTPGLMDVPVRVRGINEVTVTFGGFGRVASSDWSILGSVDRVTGDLEATQHLTDSKTGKVYSTLVYSMKCSAEEVLSRRRRRC